VRREERLKKELKRILRRLKKFYKPDKVILFGSLVEGKIHSGSDIDLLIIKKSKKRYLDRIDEFLDIVKPKIALDVFILAPEEVKNNPYVREILKIGKVIYEKVG